MKVLLSWLQEFASLPDDPALVGAAFDDLGTPVEEMTLLGRGWDGIVVAEVLDLRVHPNADKIQLVDVDAGQGATEPLQICCGAFNMAVGDLVPLATLGTTMPGGMLIERRKLRGEWSNGMLCSASELGLPELPNEQGIRVLGAGLVPGMSLVEALGVEPDVLFDLEVNPNRPDAMSVAGLARDVAAKLNVIFALPTPEVSTRGGAAQDVLEVEVAALDLCGRFGAWLLRDVKVGESPEWMQRRLLALGMRPINALVDISNYVMLELGQPNHPYDLALVAGNKLRVRRAKNGETLVTLDDVERRFTTDDLLICDGDDTAVGIAGIMGGAACEISATTTDVLLEMAWFQPMSVSRSSRRLGLRSEASSRFEKGCDPDVIPLAAARFCQLAAEICGATMASGFVDVHGEVPERAPIRLRTARVNGLLGTELSSEEIKGQLEPIGFACEADGDDQDVTVPSWRYDSATEIDIVEEVARHWGYSKIPSRELTEPRSGGLTTRQQQRRELRRLLAAQGLAEALPLPFLAPGDLARVGLSAEAIDLVNPLVADESVLRTSLLPGMVKALALNSARRSTAVGLFEIGHVFLPPPVDQLLPDEQEHLAVLLGGQSAPAAVEAWYLVADLVRALSPSVDNSPQPGLHPTRSGRLLVDGAVVGSVGEIDPRVLSELGVTERAAWLEVNIDALLGAPSRPDRYRQVSRFPSSDIDLAFEVPAELSARDLEATLLAADPLVWSVRLFDVYRGGKVGDEKRSLAYAVRLQAGDRTLTDTEVATARDGLIAAATQSSGISLRS